MGHKLFENEKKCEHFFSVLLTIWPHRLTVRTPGSHPGNPGSIPGGVTIRELQIRMSVSFSLLKVGRFFLSVK